MNRVSSISKRLKEYRNSKQLTLLDISNKTGIPAQTLNRYELNQRTPKIEVAVEIAESLNINPLWLQGYDVPMDYPGSSDNIIPFRDVYMAPIIGTIPAGYPALAYDDIEGYASIPYKDAENYFFLRVRGDSMVNAGIMDGDLVLIRRQSCAENGQIVAARVNGEEATLKRFRQEGETVYLMPENTAYTPTVVSIKDFDRGYASIIGIAIEDRHSLL